MVGEGQVRSLITESNKLEGGSNYNVWRLKMTTWFKRENMWKIFDNKVVPTSWPTSIGSHVYTEQKSKELKFMKNHASYGSERRIGSCF